MLDADAPRNRCSPTAHGGPGCDRVAPAASLGHFPADAAARSGATLRTGEVTAVERRDDGFPLKANRGRALPLVLEARARGVLAVT